MRQGSLADFRQGNGEGNKDGAGEMKRKRDFWQN